MRQFDEVVVVAVDDHPGLYVVEAAAFGRYVQVHLGLNDVRAVRRSLGQHRSVIATLEQVGCLGIEAERSARQPVGARGGRAHPGPLPAQTGLVELVGKLPDLPARNVGLWELNAIIGSFAGLGRRGVLWIVGGPQTAAHRRPTVYPI